MFTAVKILLRNHFECEIKYRLLAYLRILKTVINNAIYCIIYYYCYVSEIIMLKFKSPSLSFAHSLLAICFYLMAIIVNTEQTCDTDKV